jgi:hypothetical protein
LYAALSREFCILREPSLLVCFHGRGAARSAGALFRKETLMVTIKVKGGTPEGSDTLCRTCSHAHIIKGFRATEEDVFCRHFFIGREIRFSVCECSGYETNVWPAKRRWKRSPGS